MTVYDLGLGGGICGKERQVASTPHSESPVPPGGGDAAHSPRTSAATAAATRPASGSAAAWSPCA